MSEDERERLGQLAESVRPARLHADRPQLRSILLPPPAGRHQHRAHDVRDRPPARGLGGGLQPDGLRLGAQRIQPGDLRPAGVEPEKLVVIPECFDPALFRTGRRAYRAVPMPQT